MEGLDSSAFSSLDLPRDCEVELLGKTLLIKKWNWDFQDCLKFQKKSQEIVRTNKGHKVFIFCNHPHVFTLGRGNERGEEGLVDFSPSISDELKYPVEKIHRGGGITFHYPGQWIFYPIVKIGPSYSLDDHMCWLLKSVTSVLKEDFGIEGVLTAKKLMGVWKERKKLASIGVGVSRFVTEHGLALNLLKDVPMFEELKKISPCGMSHETYSTVEEYVSKENLLESFHSRFLASILLKSQRL